MTTWGTQPFLNLCDSLSTGLHPQSSACDAIQKGFLQTISFGDKPTGAVPQSWGAEGLTEWACGCTDHVFPTFQPPVPNTMCGKPALKAMCSLRTGELTQFHKGCGAFGLEGQTAACGQFVMDNVICRAGSV